MSLFVIRPEPGNAATVKAAQEMGLDARGYPLFTIAPLVWHAPEAETFDALLIGSANALREAGTDLALYHHKPVYAVGQASAAAARMAGFVDVRCGQFDLQSLLGQVDPHHKRLLRLAGQERTRLTIPVGFSVMERITYHVKSQPISSEFANDLTRNSMILIHSLSALDHFRTECQRLNLPLDTMTLICIAQRIAAAAGQGWAKTLSAVAPNDAEMLATARHLCQMGS